MTFIHPFFRRPVDKWDEEYFEDEVIKRVKRRIEVKWGIYCILSLLLWITVIAGIIAVIVKTTAEGQGTIHRLMERFVAGPPEICWKVRC